MKTVIKLVLASLLFGGSVANAALVNYSLIGLVDVADPFNAYGLMVGDEIFADGIFEDAGLSGVGAETVALDTGSNSLLLEVGDFSYTGADDIGSPSLSLFDGVVTGLNFIAPTDAFGSFTSNGTYFEGDDDNFNLISGNWSPTPVPVPAAVWLFGTGLLGLAGVARRKEAA